MKLLNKILIANRGEIALRIIRSAKKSLIQTVAIYTESEKEADFVKYADEAVFLGGEDLNLTYLNIDKIITIAISTGAQAIHPGYGFLSENYLFAKACEENHIIFIGPSSEVLRLMSSKPESKALAASLDIPVAASFKLDPNSTLVDEKLFQYPILIKASFGGGGKGMELVLHPGELNEKIGKATRMAKNYFGNGELFIEQYINNARHVEVQIIGDKYNNIIHLFERECSIQRNHQKIIEEAPAIFLNPLLRTRLLTAAIKIARAVNYSGAGTVEFLIDDSDNFFFMEMNPRIQVEHAITEQITGIDIVNEQLRIASGFPLSVSQSDVSISGHSIEARIYAENPVQNFTPSSAPVLSVNLPIHPNLRIESDIINNQLVKNHFDPLLIKIIVTESDREKAISLLSEQMKNLNVLGPETNTKYLESILVHPDFQNNILSVEFCKKNHKSLVNDYTIKSSLPELKFLIAFSIYKAYIPIKKGETHDVWSYAGYWRSIPQNIYLTIDGEEYNILPDLKNKSCLSFVYNGKRIDYKIEFESQNNADVRIDNETKRISAVFDNQYLLCVCIENIQYKISFPGKLQTYPDIKNEMDIDSGLGTGEIKSPLHGKILEINVIENQVIKKGDLLFVIEAMKSENRIYSPSDARIKKIAVNLGAQVTDRMPLIFLEEYK